MQPRRIGDVEDKGKLDGVRRTEPAAKRCRSESETIDVGSAGGDQRVRPSDLGGAGTEERLTEMAEFEAFKEAA